MTYDEKIKFLQQTKTAELDALSRKALASMGVSEETYALANRVIDEIIEDMYRLKGLEK